MIGMDPFLQGGNLFILTHHQCQMADGQAVETGTHAELLAQDGLYARLVRSQALAAE